MQKRNSVKQIENQADKIRADKGHLILKGLITIEYLYLFLIDARAEIRTKKSVHFLVDLKVQKSWFEIN